MKQFFILLLLICFISSCSEKYDRDEQHMKDIAKIEAYLAENGITGVQQTDSGLFYIVTVEGTGTEHPTSTSNVTCDYIGRLLDDDNVVFDANSGITFNLSQVIAGWTEGIPKLKRNGAGTFYVPSTLAYGNRAQSQIIGRNECLIFNVELSHFW